MQRPTVSVQDITLPHGKEGAGTLFAAHRRDDGEIQQCHRALSIRSPSEEPK
jgi:hypothetical protein